MRLRTLDSMDLRGKRVLVRVDLNVPVEGRHIRDAARLDAVLPTLRTILARGGRPVLLSHFGRPNGRRVPSLSLEPAARLLGARLAEAAVRFSPDCVGEAAEKHAARLTAGEILLCENTRFHAGEERNDPAFAARLARLGDVFCADAFSAAHRAHASTTGVAAFLPACAGRLMQREIDALERTLAHPARPVMALVGGAKISTKIAILQNLATRMDGLIVGGAMANSFLAAQGIAIGVSRHEPAMHEKARAIAQTAREAGCALLLPEDIVVAEKLAPGAQGVNCPVSACPKEGMILDVGPRTVATIVACLESIRTLLWNGPLGAFEFPPFDRATVTVARSAARLTDEGRLLTVAGGGDTVAALNAAGAGKDFSYLSHAGGAFLEWLGGKTLPGVAVIMDGAS